VNLSRLVTEQVRRGDVVSTDAALPTTERMDVAVRGIDESSEALADGSAAVVHIGTDRAAARLHSVDSGFAQLVLESPIPCFGGIGFVLRGFSADPRQGAVIGGGRVLDANPEPLPPRRNEGARQARARVLASLERGDWHGGVRGLLDIACPKPLGGSDIEHRLGLEPGTVGKWFETDAPGIVPLGDGTSFVVDDALEALRRRAVDIVQTHHDRAPHDAGISLETLRAETALRTTREAADLAIERAQRSGDLVVTPSGLVGTPRFAEARRTETAAGRRLVLEVLGGAGLSGIGETDLIGRTGLPADAARSILAELSAEAAVRRLADLWFSERVIDELRRHVAGHFRKSDELTITAFKDLTGVGRKQAIPLLEQLDREGTTRRVGDTRRAGARIPK
jgi:selenocysteine-specific elongation factor